MAAISGVGMGSRLTLESSRHNCGVRWRFIRLGWKMKFSVLSQRIKHWTLGRNETYQLGNKVNENNNILQPTTGNIIRTKRTISVTYSNPSTSRTSLCLLNTPRRTSIKICEVSVPPMTILASVKSWHEVVPRPTSRLKCVNSIELSEL